MEARACVFPSLRLKFRKAGSGFLWGFFVVLFIVVSGVLCLFCLFVLCFLFVFGFLRIFSFVVSRKVLKKDNEVFPQNSKSAQ